MEHINVNEVGNVSSLFLVRNDAETILSIMKSENDPIFQLSIVPYYSMFYHSCQEYMNLSLSKNEIAAQITSIRHYIKTLSNGFSKSAKRIDTVDAVQNDSFRNQLKFDFLRDTNIHYNLGIYFNDNNKIVGNTQYISDCLGIEDVFDTSKKYGNRSFEIGRELSSFVSSVSKGFGSRMTPPIICRCDTGVSIPYYADLNTNLTNAFFNLLNNKSINLFFLYLLSTVNFVSEILEPLVLAENTWVFRVKYIVNYYAVRALQRYKNYCDNNQICNTLDGELREILSLSESLFNSTFRNCMMHYRIQDIIKKEYWNLDIPFFGLIESCFDGIDFSSFYAKQDALTKKIILFLEKQFNINVVQFEKL